MSENLYVEVFDERSAVLDTLALLQRADDLDESQVDLLVEAAALLELPVSADASHKEITVALREYFGAKNWDEGMNDEELKAHGNIMAI